MLRAAPFAPWVPPAAAPIFDAVLTPNDSSTPKSRKALTVFFAAYAAVMTLLWVSLAAWPALLHGALVAGVLFWSLRADRRRAQRWERVVVWRDVTRVVTGVGGNALETVEWPTPWLRAALAPEAVGVALSCAGREALVGRDLAPYDRRGFADALAAALADARRPV